MTFLIRWCSASSEASGRPTKRRFKVPDTSGKAKRGGPSRSHKDLPATTPRGLCTVARTRAGRVEWPAMHVIVVGCGRVGSELATTLDKAGHSVSIIDKSRNAF